MLEPQLHARRALRVEQAVVVLVQREDGLRLVVGVGAQLVEEEGEGVFVVGEEGGEGGV
jgi:hypothetical protein